MKVHFYLHYGTNFGESFSLQLSNGETHPLEYLNDELWQLSLDLKPASFPNGLAYTCLFHSADGLHKPEADPGRHLDLSQFPGEVSVFDYYNPLS